MRYISPPKETPLGWTKVDVANHKYVFDKVVNGISCRLVFVFLDNESGFYQVYVDNNRPYIGYSLNEVNTFCEKETTRINELADSSFRFVGKQKLTVEVFEFKGEDYNFINKTWYYLVDGVRFPVEDSNRLEDLSKLLYKLSIETNV
jgi:hypothetical protein